MKTALLASLLLALTVVAEVPPNLVVDGVPELSPDVVARTRPYFDFRTATLMSWHPSKAEMLIKTRFADAAQLHIVKMPGGDRKQITFFDDTVAGGEFRPTDPNMVVFSKDTGGNENFQIHAFDRTSGATTLLTDGKSRNQAGPWSRDGKWLAFTSTRRTGNDSDLWVVDPSDPASARMVLQVEGGGWYPIDFSRDSSRILVGNYISATDSNLYLVEKGVMKLLTPKRAGQQAVYFAAGFSADDSEIFVISDEMGEFRQLYRMKTSDGSKVAMTASKWDVSDVTLSDDRSKIAWTTNENGADVLRVLDLRSGKDIATPKLAYGVLGGLEFHPTLPLLGLAINSARSATDVFAIDLEKADLIRWTESETGGLNVERNVEPQLVSWKSFDGTPISGFLYRPDPARFPGKRPLIITIHGGPEAQSRPAFLGRNNYWINELGIAIIYPNVRGSEGYGKTFVAMDNGVKREDSVRDIGALIDWVSLDPAIDSSRIGVYGGSYGGYMVLASMIHFSDKLRAGIDVVGISDFVTFLTNTSGYRRDLRRVEYGDEREPAMLEVMNRISPLRNASKIKDPLFVIMGFNDPRVPYTEGEQIMKSVRANGAPVWFLMAKDEGHGFAKRKNQDFQFNAMTMFWEAQLLK